MKQYNFDTNIEKRMPQTGNVFFVDRMTSDYAAQHPFNVDEYIEGIFEKYEQMTQEDAAFFGGIMRDRNSLRQMWNNVLGDMNPGGDASLYPNRNGRREPALMEVWHKAGDFWRRGFRIGDVLPAIVPGCKITRIEDGWIALFPKDMGLLGSPVINDCEITETESSCDSTVASDEPITEIVAVENEVPLQAEIEQIETNQATADEDLENLNQFDEFLGEADPVIASEQNHAPQPIQLDLFAQMQEELAALRAENADLTAKNENLTKQCNMTQTEVCTPHNEFDTENCSCATQGQPSTSRESRHYEEEQREARRRARRDREERKRRQQEQAGRAYERLYSAPTITDEQNYGHGIRSWLKPLGIAAASVAALVIIFNTGLLIPLGILGLATGGILK